MPERSELLASAGISIFVPAVAKPKAANANPLPGAADLLNMTQWDAANPHPNRQLFEFAEILDRIEPDVHGFTVRDIASVDAIWGYTDNLHFDWMGSVVLRLRSGRFACIWGNRTPVYFAPEDSEETRRRIYAEKHGLTSVEIAAELKKDPPDYYLTWTLKIEFVSHDTRTEDLLDYYRPDQRIAEWDEAPEHLNEFLKRVKALRAADDVDRYESPASA